VEFVDEAGGEQIVPEGAAAEDQDVAARALFELGDLLPSKPDRPRQAASSDSCNPSSASCTEPSIR
jgi:hypothetical protein